LTAAVSAEEHQAWLDSGDGGPGYDSATVSTEPAPSSPRADSERGEGGSSGLGGRLRAERLRAGKSLRGLAAELKITPSALSQIETGRTKPSVDTLYAVVNVLDLSLDELFGASRSAASGTRSASPYRVHRPEARKVIEMESGVRWERLTPDGESAIDFLYVVYEVGGASSPRGQFVRHAGREYGLLLSGRLKVTLGFQEFELQPGDAITFDSTTPHRLETVGDEPAVAVWCALGRYDSDPRLSGNEGRDDS
jgi:transcriptional regulator with XRE-family HTH domain